MTNQNGFGTGTQTDEMADILGRVRQVDPIADEAAVRGYMKEIADASTLLDTVQLGDAALQVSFSAWWPDGPGR